MIRYQEVGSSAAKALPNSNLPWGLFFSKKKQEPISKQNFRNIYISLYFSLKR